MKGKLEKNAELLGKLDDEKESHSLENSAGELDGLGRSKNAEEAEKKENINIEITAGNGAFALDDQGSESGVNGEIYGKIGSDKKSKKRKKKRLFEFQFPVIKNSRKNIQKIGKKPNKNIINNQQNASFVGVNGAKTNANIIDKNSKKLEQGSKPKTSKLAGAERQINSKTKQGDTSHFVVVAPQKENTEKIAKKSEKNSSKNEQKIEENTTKIIFATQKTDTKNQEKADKIDAINKDDKSQNEAKSVSDRANKNQRNGGFVYAEVMPKTSKKQKQQAELIARLMADKERADERRRIEENERFYKKEKMRDIMRERRSIEYGLDSIERKAMKWQKISEEAYEEAMLHSYTLLFGDKAKKIFGMTTYDIYMSASVTAMRYCLEYQHDLELERERIRQKDRALAELLERM